eukprot:2558989-Pyramimonas_sp.AAC.1
MKQGDTHAVHKLSRLIAGRHRGPRQRQYRVLAVSAASAREWQRRMILPGRQGGCSAVATTDTELLQRVHDRSLQRCSVELSWEYALDDWKQMRRRVWRMKLWRTWPQWSLPVELLRMIMHPKWVNPRRPKVGAGVGHSSEFTLFGASQVAIRRLLFAFRRAGRLPIQMHKALACRLPKNNFKESCDGERIIMVMCTM